MAVRLTHGSAEVLQEHAMGELDNSNFELGLTDSGEHRAIAAVCAEVVGKLEAGYGPECVEVEFSQEAFAWLQIARAETVAFFEDIEPVVGESVSDRRTEADQALLLLTLDRIVESPATASPAYHRARQALSQLGADDPRRNHRD